MAGLAEYCQVDVTVLRLLAVVAGLITGPAIIVAYIAAMVITPKVPVVTPPQYSNPVDA